MLAPASHAAAQDLFDRTADDYRARAETRVHDLTSIVFARRKEVVLSLLDESGVRGTLLDFGMGPGVFAREVVERGFHFVGVDIAPQMIDRARSMGLPDTTFVQGDIGVLDDWRGKADAVIAIGLIDYLEDPADGLRRLASCLRPGGVLIVSFRNHFSVNTGLREIAKRVYRRFFAGMGLRPKSAFVSAVHEKSFSPRQLRTMLGRLGMKDFRVRYHNVTPGLFVNLRLAPAVWNAIRRADVHVAGRLTSAIADAGVIACRI